MQRLPTFPKDLYLRIKKKEGSVKSITKTAFGMWPNSLMQISLASSRRAS